MLSGEFIECAASMVESILKMSILMVEDFNPSLKEFLFGLGILGLFLFGEDLPLHFIAESLLNVPDPLLMLRLILVEHLLVHKDLLGKGGLDPIPFLLELSQSVLEDADGGFRLAYFRGFLLDPFEVGGLLIEHIVHQFAGGEGKFRIGCLSKFLRGQTVESNRGVIPAHATAKKLLHFHNNIY
jgi:hypothetical protein